MFLLGMMLYACQPATWDEPLEMVGTQAKGMLAVKCAMEKKSGGTLEDLYQATVGRIHKEATVHFTELTEFKGMPGRKFDATTNVVRGDNTLTVRADVVTARGDTRYVMFESSTQITATGPAKNIEHIMSAAQVDAVSQGGYKVLFISELIVNKPPAVPKKKFLEIVKREAEAEMQFSQDEAIKFFQETL